VSDNIEKMKRLINKAIVNKDHNFGNARWVRNIFEKTLEIQANRLAMDGHISNKSLTTITEYDIMNKTD
jgi:stage V sporulation protein K